MGAVNNLDYGQWNNTFAPKINTIVYYPIFGFEISERWGDKIGPGELMRIQFNYYRVGSYIPFIHLIAGVGYVALGIFTLLSKKPLVLLGDLETNKGIGKRFVIRGVLTFLLGPALAIADFAKQYLQNKEIQEINRIKEPIPLIELKRRQASEPLKSN